MVIHELINPLEVHCPLGRGKAIAWIDYGVDINTVWKVVFHEDGSVRNLFDDEIRIYPNKMNGEKIIIPDNWKK